ncbi:acyltransferase family protein [Pseudomonadota bacterium]
MIDAGKLVKKDLHRIQYLDGLRGIAIFLVLLYHAFVRWPEIIPFEDRFSGIPLFANGWLGVHLFFVISGYVIHMTLDKPQSPINFFVRRWLRLFPAMLICSIIIYSTAGFFFERPSGSPVLRDLLPGLTFIDPIWWSKLIGPPQGQLEGAFWSLYVEVKFYLLAGLFYFVFGEKKMVWMLCIVFLSYVALPFLSDLFPNAQWSLAQQILFVLSAKYFGWFAAGSLFYLYVREQRAYIMILAVVIGLISAFSLEGWGVQATYAGIAIVLLFTAAILSKRMQSLLANPFLLLLGFASYPLYLLHENMMVSLIIKIGNFAPWIPAVLIPVIPMSIVITLGWLVAKYAELWTRNSILNSYQHVSRLFRRS